jgi:hypothetical protein
MTTFISTWGASMCAVKRAYPAALWQNAGFVS